MRYTLRLLTAQQFLRASSLICVLEDIRSQLRGRARHGAVRHRHLARWRLDAEQLEGGRAQSRDSCGATTTRRTSSSCCGARGAARRWGRGRRARGQDTPGYDWTGDEGRASAASTTSAASAAATDCRSTSSTRTSTTSRPSIVIGTVDKFAMMAWQPEARSLFGLGEQRRARCARRPG